MTRRSYAAWLDDEIPEEKMAIDFIEEYKKRDRRNNLRYMLVELIDYQNENHQVIEQIKSQELEAVLNLAHQTNANFGELFNWMTQLPDFMRELKKQLVGEIAQAITMSGGNISFHKLPDLADETQRRALDEKSKRQQKQISDLLNLE